MSARFEPEKTGIVRSQALTLARIVARPGAARTPAHRENKRKPLPRAAALAMARFRALFILVEQS
jgi:hypothetical protein